jgi:hypothetical protein
MSVEHISVAVFTDKLEKIYRLAVRSSAMSISGEAS